MDVEPEDPRVPLRRACWHGDVRSDDTDEVVREEPLEIRIGGIPVAVVMRTPGHDEELVMGFLATEGVVDGPEAVGSVRHCTVVEDPEVEGNVVQVTLREGIEVDWARLRRNLYASSSCGLCGKASIDQLMLRCEALQDDARIEVGSLYGLPARLETAQTVFARTGGLHAAGLFDAEGEPLVVREDVGRHNAVDKVVGWASQRGLLPLRGHVLMVSGRVSFEIAQKTVVAGIPVLAAVSAPSSLAVELAKRAGMTLVAFLRGQRLSVYAGAERIVARAR
ncbi:formate dehydrogenase accessory sulfurtransferase FdhD [Paraliomyxa miuraensis]|uniref:formate dehydrogenase accessory sulfurtransferase FdhD n=1 Tax=Paraliomyxa miuraensis TaxID=376150 RepID=UPI0022548597|nr:formate dehydrogenase accessory sulfurtransferase FdhD [Paraliomyxa miuraensis]MCX4246130.1 formate dehydrogenase accessory sulfurtransferase FdhD [Paraliomyxa miuraensis]